MNLLLGRLKLRSGYALAAFQPPRQPNPRQRAKAHQNAAFRHPRGVIFAREEEITFGCDLTGT
jgi:hypothetical protein